SRLTGDSICRVPSSVAPTHRFESRGVSSAAWRVVSPVANHGASALRLTAPYGSPRKPGRQIAHYLGVDIVIDVKTVGCTEQPAFALGCGEVSSGVEVVDVLAAALLRREIGRDRPALLEKNRPAAPQADHFGQVHESRLAAMKRQKQQGLAHV